MATLNNPNSPYSIGKPKSAPKKRAPDSIGSSLKALSEAVQAYEVSIPSATAGLNPLELSLSMLGSNNELRVLVEAHQRWEQEHEAHHLNFESLYASPKFSVVEAVKSGVSPTMVNVLSAEMGLPKEWVADRLGLAPATVRRKAADAKLLSADESEKVIGMSRLIGQVQSMVNEAGNPEGFDAAAWLAQWMEQGLPALGGRKPSEYMDTAVGQALVSQLLDQIRSGAYA